MARVLSLLVLPILAQASFVSLRKPTVAAPLEAKPVAGHVVMTAEQKKAAHSGCTNACKPSPVESKCVTECETAMYRCIDETGPNETPKDTDKCQAGVLKLFTETKGVAKKAEAKKEGKKEEKKADKKKAKSFLQLKIKDVDDADDDVVYDADEESQDEDDESAYAGDEDVTGGREASEEESSEEDTDEEAAGDEEEAGSDEEEAVGDEDEDSFLQTSRGDGSVGDMTEAEAEEKASEVAQEDEDKAALPSDDEEASSDDEEESFIQTKKRNIDDDNAEAAEMARLEAQSDKDMGEDDDESSKSDDDESAASEDEESFVQTKRNIDDDNAEAAEMARLEAQSDKDMGEDDDTTSTDDSSDSAEESEE